MVPDPLVGVEEGKSDDPRIKARVIHVTYKVSYADAVCSTPRGGRGGAAGGARKGPANAGDLDKELDSFMQNDKVSWTTL